MNTTVNSKESDKLRATATHEAAHGVIAERLIRQPATISIERQTNDTGDVWFKGSCKYVAGDAAAERAISLAGPIAEALFRGHSSGAALRNAVSRLMSAGDRVGAGHFSLQEADATLRLVRENWAAIEARADLEVARFLGTASAPASQATHALASDPSHDEIGLVHFGTNRRGEVVKTYLDFAATNPTQNLGRVRSGFALIGG